MKFLKYFSSGVLALSIIYVHAQQKEVELDPITVTASVTPLSASKTGRNIIIVKGEQLNRLPVQSIDELIRYIPGIEVQSRGPMGTQSNITIRGGTFQQVLIILDGIRLNDPLTGHFNSYIPISPAEIDRIEILKGASSAVYGTEAVGGVVHIITKTFASRDTKNSYRINSQLAAGDFGLLNIQTGGNFRINKTTGAVGIISNNAKGQPLRGVRGFFNLTTISASLKQEIGKHFSIAYRFGFDDRNFSAQNFYTQFLSDSATENVTSTWNHVKLDYNKGNHHLELHLGSKKAKDEFQFRKAVNPNINNSTLQQALLLYDYKLNNRSIITTGSQFIGRKIRSNDRGDHSVDAAGVFVILNQKVGENFQLNPALRVDWNERAGWEVVPQLNMSYRYKQFLFRGSAGRTTRDADFTERFNNYKRNPVPSGSRIGNPDLVAESSFSYELGADYFAGSNLKLSTTWFERFHTRLIDWIRTPYADMPRKDNLLSTGIYNLAKNIDKVNTTGIETDIQYQKTINEKQSMNAAIGFIWMRSRSSDTIPSLYVSNHANELVNFNFTYTYKFIAVGINGLYKARKPRSANPAIVPISKDYFLLNMRTDAYLVKNRLSLFVQVDNIFNRRYSDILGTVMPQRWAMGGIKLLIQ